MTEQHPEQIVPDEVADAANDPNAATEDTTDEAADEAEAKAAAEDAAEAAAAAKRAEEQAAADKYDQMMRLADLFDSTGEEMRVRAQLGAQVLGDEDVAESAELARATFTTAEEDILAATSGKHGLLSRSIELDADALIVRATVLTYRWIDELQYAAYRTLGSIAGRAIGYLAPEVELGGAVVSAGLIETDALDREGLAAYLNELADNNPELMEHVTSGGGGLLDSLQMRSLLTAGVMGGPDGAAAARGGLRAAGVEPFPHDAMSALRDIAGAFEESGEAESAADAAAAEADVPRNIEELMATLESLGAGVAVQKLAPSRYIAYLAGQEARRASDGPLRLVGGDHSAYASEVVGHIEAAVNGDGGARVMLVGSAQGGVTAAEIAAEASSDKFVIDQVITAGAPSAQVPVIPAETNVLSLEDRSDPVALLGSLINAGVTNRLTVVFDGGQADGDSIYVVGGRAADTATHPDLRAAITRIQELGFLAG
ncbi:hypothetical protein [Nocardioides speluncae]|uniref:hypothetical protein n=1 Tax=Nocardioides speluncae TaxID=2670337 RepID=UPI000D6912E1|nr:hypothetical protein [Nocardioides speluncae]